ncbi:MAG: hypothetical protein JJE52_14350 [Acidimicrobiia bacterium]|nr:hypothetical protein [Acidimicrobiia bacterium]
MTGGVWIASYVALWIAVVVLGVAVVALLRQIGVLHARVRPMGVHFGGEGPERHAPAPLPERFAFDAADVTLLAFTSPTCEICHSLLPGLRALRRDEKGLALELIDHGPSTLEVFSAYAVTGTPYVVAVDRAGIVQARGVANTLDQVEEMLDEVRTDLAPTAPETSVDDTHG